MTLETLPDISYALRVMKLEDDLLARANRKTLRGLAIVMLFEMNKNKLHVIDIVRNEVLKYPEQMVDIIGADLVKRLKAFE